LACPLGGGSLTRMALNLPSKALLKTTPPLARTGAQLHALNNSKFSYKLISSTYPKMHSKPA
jgi:hypothetical protein